MYIVHRNRTNYLYYLLLTIFKNLLPMKSLTKKLGQTSFKMGEYDGAVKSELKNKDREDAFNKIGRDLLVFRNSGRSHINETT